MEYYTAIKNQVYVSYVVKWQSAIRLKLYLHRQNEGKNIHKCIQLTYCRDGIESYEQKLNCVTSTMHVQ